MKEYVTESIVLTIEPHKEHDLTADLYTKDLGRVKARVVSGRKILSKFSPHLNPLNLVSVRLVEKKQFTVTDVLTDDYFFSLRNDVAHYSTAVHWLNILKVLVPFAVPDAHLWHFLCHSFANNSINYHSLFKILGYDVSFAQCAICFNNEIASFSLNNQVFLCSFCSGRMKDDTLVIGE